MTQKKFGYSFDLKAGDLSGLQALSTLQTELTGTRTVIDQIRANGGIGGVAVGADEVEKAELKLSQLTAQAALAERELANLAVEMQALDPASQAFEKAQARATELQQKLIGIREAAESIPASFTDYGSRFAQASDRASVFGDTSSGISAVGGLVGTFSPEASAALMAGVGITDTLEALPRLQESFRELGARAKDLPGILGSVASLGAAAAGGLGGAAAGLGAIVAVAAPIIAVVGGVALALKSLSDNADAARAEVERQNEAFDRQLALRREVGSLAQGDLGTFEAARADALAAQADEQTRLDQAQAERDRITAEYDNLGASLNPGERARLGAEGQAADARLAEVTAAFEQATERVAEFAEFTDAALSNDSARRAAAEQLDTLMRRAEIERQLNDIIAQGNTGAIHARRDAISQEIHEIEDLIASLRGLGEGNEAAAAQIDALTQQRDALFDEDTLYRDAVARTADTAAMNDQIAALQARAQAEIDLRTLTESATVEQIEARQHAIEIEREALQTLLPELEALSGESETAAQALTDAQERLRALGEESANLTATVLPAARARQIADGAAAVTAAESDRDSAIERLRAQSLERVEELEMQHGKTLEKIALQAEDALRAAIAKAVEARAKINTDYMKSEAKAYENFLREEREKTDAANVDRLRKLEDLNITLGKAEADNNVVAFLEAQAQAKLALERDREDLETAQQQRQDAFLRERDEARTNYDARLAEVEAVMLKESEMIRTRREQQIDASNAALEEQTQKLDKSLQDQINAQNDAADVKLAALREQYRIEGTLATGQAKDISEVFSGVLAFIELGVQQLRRRAASFASTPVSSSGRGRSGRSGGFMSQARAFADGGIVLPGEEVVGIFERERSYAEAVIPLERGLLNRFGLGGNSRSVVINTGGINITGEGVTIAEVNKGLDLLRGEILEAIDLVEAGT